MLLSVKDLHIVLKKAPERVILNHVGFDVKEESVLALVGESGSGKTTTGFSIMGLLPDAFDVISGQIIFQGQDLRHLPKEELRKIRGRDIGFIFQEPLNAFNPLFTVGYQIGEVLAFHTDLNAKERRARVMESLRLAGIKDAGRVYRSYPHQLSGGMRQRAMIAQAICANPRLIIADEPTSNLDVTLQAKIIGLLRGLKEELKLSIILITHDLGIVRHLADEVVVLKDGNMIEQGKADDVLRNPAREYTKALLKAAE